MASISTQFGTYGTANGQFNGVYDVAVDSSENVWVADYSNNRIQEFSPTPRTTQHHASWPCRHQPVYLRLVATLVDAHENGIDMKRGFTDFTRFSVLRYPRQVSQCHLCGVG